MVRTLPWSLAAVRLVATAITGTAMDHPGCAGLPVHMGVRVAQTEVEG